LKSHLKPQLSLLTSQRMRSLASLPGITRALLEQQQNGALLVVLNKDMIYQDENEEACSEMLKRLECYEGDAGY
jgi:hypothetical protein